MAGLELHPGLTARFHAVWRLLRNGAGDLCLRLRGLHGRPRCEPEELAHSFCSRHGVRRGAVLVHPADTDAGFDLERPVIGTALTDLWYGFGVALEPHNIMWCFIGVLVGNMVGVLPGMGPLATISILLPLTFGIKPVGAILMLAGVMYGAQYGGASWGITEMIFLAPLLVIAALQFGPAEICSLMLLGLLAGSTLARGSPVKGVAMTVLGLMLGIVGTDLETGAERFTFGMTHLDDGIELIALALGLFGIAEF